MKIAYIADPSSIHVVRWVTEFRQRGHDCVVYAPAGWTDAELDFIPIGRPGRGGLLGFATRLLDLRRKLAEFGPDIVHSHYAVDFGTWGALSGRRPFVLTLWGSDIYLTLDGSRLLRWKVRTALKRADAITVDSADLGRAAVSLGADASRTTHVVLGVDTDELSPLAKRAGRPLVLSTRQLHPIYNVGSLLEAAAALRARGLDFELVIVGDGPVRTALENSTEARTLGDALRFTGFLDRPQLARLYREADVYVTVPQSDGTAVSLLEAMAGGAAVVASDLESNREWVSPDDGNRLVPVGDAMALGRALRELIDDPDLRRRAGEANRRKVVECGDWRKEMDRMEALYLRLAGGRA